MDHRQDSIVGYLAFTASLSPYERARLDRLLYPSLHDEHGNRKTYP